MMGSVVDQMGPALEFVKSHVVLDGPMLRLALFLIFASPTWWNLGGRLEHRFRIFRKIFFGNKYVACYFFSATVFTLSAVRNYVYKLAVEEQPKANFGVDPLLLQIASWALYSVGMIFVVSSSLRLGITGTYCGDYFGILMKERVTGFPFSVVEDPMYLGSTLNFLAMAVGEQSVSGLLLTAVVYTVYVVYSIWLENPYTAWIYSEKARQHREREEKLEADLKTSKSAAKSPASPKRSNKKKVE
jgi:methylene-fatty-acyl-phospholipid synthase